MKKIGSLERFLTDADPDAIIADIELARTSKHHQKGLVFRCEVNLTIGKTLLRAEELGESIVEAIDKIRDEIESEVHKLKGKRQARFLRAARDITRRFKF